MFIHYSYNVFDIIIVINLLLIELVELVHRNYTLYQL